jgi:hypothetical protein
MSIPTVPILSQGECSAMQSRVMSWLGFWWRGLLVPACLLIGSCAAPGLAPVPDPTDQQLGETAPIQEAVEERGRIRKPEADVGEEERAAVSTEPRLEQLERRLQAVVTCLEKARQAVVAAEVAGAGIEVVRPAIYALHRSEAALRKAQAQLIQGRADQAASPLDVAEAECQAARALSHQI